jgi:uncharacterized protein (TIGR02118 family)
VVGRREPPAYDGVAELWFDDWDAWRQATASEQWAALRQDELNFIDHSRSCLIVTEEKLVVQ